MIARNLGSWLAARSSIRLTAVLGICAAWACGSSPSGDAGAADASRDSGAVKIADALTDSLADSRLADAATPYPSGPYGNTANAVFPDLSWEGYIDDRADALATTKAYGPYSPDVARRSGRRYALIHVSEAF